MNLGVRPGVFEVSGPRDFLSKERRTAVATLLARLEGRSEVPDNPKLREDHRAFGIAVESLDPAVLEFEDVGTRSIHPFARCRKCP